MQFSIRWRMVDCSKKRGDNIGFIGDPSHTDGKKDRKMTKKTPNRKLTSNAREARRNILTFVKRTGKTVFSFDDVAANSITMRKLVGSGVIVRHVTETTETSKRKTYKLSKREICRLDGIK